MELKWRANMMRRFVIERDIPAVGKMTKPELEGAAETSIAALEKLAPRVQWEHSYVADDKTFCIYLAEDESAIRDHASLSGIPVTKITPISGILHPTGGYTA
jgi:hypothetical protein